MRYEAYCLMDPHFYDRPTHAHHTNRDSDFEQTRCPVPDGWARGELDDWVVYNPDDVELPAQGWKIHVSACVDDAEQILDTVWDYCIRRRISFKFRQSGDALLIANLKYAPRGSSGKFVTIYPVDEAQLERVLTELDRLLRGRRGPYILSDLRWGNGPLYVRYGGFLIRYCLSPTGHEVPAIEDGSGRLVPDVRGPTFQVPPWVTLPGFLEPHLAARNSTTTAGLPYRVESALHFSNGGGVYLAEDVRTGQRVVLKEARPYAGLTADRADAVERQRRERMALERLRGLDCAPELYGHFVLGDHHFLVEEFVEGPTLNDLFVQRFPLLGPEIGDAVIADYTRWVLDMLDKVETAVAAVHERGVAIGDVHPHNILVRPDGRVALIDFEVASDAAEERHQTLAAAGYMAPRDLTGTDIDDYALACMRLSMFMPLTSLTGLSEAKAWQLAGEVTRSFPVPHAFVAEAVRVINGTDGEGPAGAGTDVRLEPDHPSWVRARDSMAAAILAAATPERDDRLFPGDIEQFSTPGGGLNVAYGAAGVLYALDVTGAGRHPGHEEWLVQRALHPERGIPLGFYDGLHGIAHVLDRLGRRDEALKVLGMCMGEQWEQLGPALYGGLSGVGLNLLHFATATGDPAFLDAALRAADLVADRLGPADAVPEISGGDRPYAGLMHGSSGPALMFLRLHEHTGDPGYLDLAAMALRQDLRRCVVREHGELHVNEGWRSMPYLAEGSVGIGTVLGDYLAHRGDDQFVEAAAGIRRAASGQFYVQSGLFRGTAGIILHLCRAHPPGTAAERDPLVADQVRRLSRQALTHQGHLVFPGEQLLRLSMDLATGSAGVMLAVGAALHPDPVQLPFLGPRRADGTQRAAESQSSVLVTEGR